MTRRGEVIQNLQVSLWEYNRKGGVKRALQVLKDANEILQYQWGVYFKCKTNSRKS